MLKITLIYYNYCLFIFFIIPLPSWRGLSNQMILEIMLCCQGLNTPGRAPQSKQVLDDGSDQVWFLNQTPKDYYLARVGIGRAPPGQQNGPDSP